MCGAGGEDPEQVLGRRRHAQRWGNGSQCLPRLLSATACAWGSLRVSLHGGEDVLWGVRFWAGAHEQPPACSEQSAAVSLHSANKEASLSVHNVPSVLSAAQW